jgi:hypothetical protein
MAWPRAPEEKVGVRSTSAFAGKLPEAFQMFGRMHVSTTDGIGDVTDIQVPPRIYGDAVGGR